MSNQARVAVLEQDCDAHALHAGLDVVPADDPSARRLLQCAQGTLHRWPEVFPGFSARDVDWLEPRSIKSRRSLRELSGAADHD